MKAVLNLTQRSTLCLLIALLAGCKTAEHRQAYLNAMLQQNYAAQERPATVKRPAAFYVCGNEAYPCFKQTRILHSAHHKVAKKSSKPAASRIPKTLPHHAPINKRKCSCTK